MVDMGRIESALYEPGGKSRGVNTMTVFSSGRGVHPNLRERDRYKLALANC